jgi:nucleotide-binding universal stress UspA family protein
MPENIELAVETEVIMGVFFDELKNACDRINPYAVVMGAKGATSAERFLFGSNSVYAAKHLPWPVITIPLGVKFTAIKNIGLACDFDHVIETIPVDEIKLLIKDFNAELHVLNAGKQTEFDPEVVFQSGMLQEMLEGSKAQYHFIAAEDKDQGIVDFAANNNIDLLLVLPKRHGLLDKLIHKSHTKQLVLHSHVPVMMLHQVA